ncbi:MAG: hypothetical protein IKY44_05945, partial [Clostridia bacterium]|nr:hypothetical protein [Clostridia bacterium]
MFAKLLKHECRAIFKYWWIAAVSSVLFAMLAGFCSQITDVFYTTHYEIQAVAGILAFFSRVALFAFPVLAALLVFIRFRKHLFSDEGYLTFTLPVSKGALLGSKLVTAMIFAAASVILLEIDYIIASICYGEPLVAIYNDIIGLMKEIYSPYDLEAVIF